MVKLGKRITMTLVGGFGLLFVLACAVAPVATQPGAETFRVLIGAPVAGDNIRTSAYCVGVDEAFMKRFTGMLTQYGTRGYWDFIEQKGAPCFDRRMNRRETKPVRAILLERLWEFDLFEGSRYVMWKIKDEAGTIAYTWTKIEGQET